MLWPHFADVVTELDDFCVMRFLAGRFDLFIFLFFLRQHFVISHLADHVGHSLAEFTLEQLNRNFLIFNRVVQEGCDD